MPERFSFEQVRAVYFDAVGTVLFPSRSAPEIYVEMAHQFGLSLSAREVRERFNQAFFAEELIDQGQDWRTDEAREVARWQAIVAASLPGSPPECFTMLYGHFGLPDAWRVPPDAVALFAWCQSQGWRLGLASNYDHRLNAVVAGLPELAPLRANMVISSQVGIRKPGAGFFQAIVQQANLDSSQILYIGDDLHNDYEGATAAGFPAILLDATSRHLHIPHRVERLTDLLPSS